MSWLKILDSRNDAPKATHDGIELFKLAHACICVRQCLEALPDGGKWYSVSLLSDFVIPRGNLNKPGVVYRKVY